MHTLPGCTLPGGLPHRSDIPRRGQTGAASTILCVACRDCVMACPYEARSYNATRPREYYSGLGMTEYKALGYTQHPKGSIERCTSCAYRLREGKAPACMATCPSGARVFGNLDNPASAVSELVASGLAKPRLEDQGTKPSVFYIEEDSPF